MKITKIHNENHKKVIIMKLYELLNIYDNYDKFI